ncbi:MAG: YggT family protein [bacterium]|nr:YggT family protein [bacterium]
MDSYTSPTTKPLYRGVQVVWYLVGILEALLLFRFLLKIFAANPNAGFTSFVYGATSIFVFPFNTVFQTTSVTPGSVFEWTTLLAMLVYWLIGLAIIRLFLMGRTVSTREAARRLDEEEKDK